MLAVSSGLANKREGAEINGVRDGIRGLLPSKNGWFFLESKVKKKGETLEKWTL
jgi:hypothetical protein